MGKGKFWSYVAAKNLDIGCRWSEMLSAMHLTIMHFVQHDQSLLLRAILQGWQSQRSQHACHTRSIVIGLSAQNVSSCQPLHHLNLFYKLTGLGILDPRLMGDIPRYVAQLMCTQSFSVLEKVSANSVSEMPGYHLQLIYSIISVLVERKIRCQINAQVLDGVTML